MKQFHPYSKPIGMMSQTDFWRQIFLAFTKQRAQWGCTLGTSCSCAEKGIFFGSPLDRLPKAKLGVFGHDPIVGTFVLHQCQGKANFFVICRTKSEQKFRCNHRFIWMGRASTVRGSVLFKFVGVTEVRTEAICSTLAAMYVCICVNKFVLKRTWSDYVFKSSPVQMEAECAEDDKACH